MDNKKSLKIPKIFSCKSCEYISCSRKDYNKHLSTLKHLRIMNGQTNDNEKSLPVFQCSCGKSYKYKSGLCKHKKTCTSPKNPPIKSHDEVIENLTKENREMKSMFLMMLEKYQETQLENMKMNENTLKVMKDSQEMVNKFIDAIPKCGNVNNTYIEKQTLNFYLTNTCRNAESIHDFTDRYVKRCVEFFQNNSREVAYNQINLASNVYDIFFKCLADNPQYMNFVQTTDVKNGVLYVKEKKKDQDWEKGEAEFIKYIDGFEKAGLNISHAIHKAFNPLQVEFEEQLKEECGEEPREDDYSSEDEYDRDIINYREKMGQVKCNFLTQVFDTVRMFDNKSKRTEILSNTKRATE